MRNRSAWLMIIVSIAMGLGAVVIAAQWLAKRANVATNRVVVAARDLPAGTQLTIDMLQSVDWPSSMRPDGAAQSEKDLESRVIKTNMQRGEVLLEAKLAPVGTKGGLSALIASGKRAITVKVNEVVGVAGFALPGNHVDVMVNTRDQADRAVSKIVLEQILVLAVAQEANRDETKPKVVNAVTLEVSPEQAEKIDLARSVGNLSLVLRNQLDKEVATTEGARKASLLPEQQRAPEPPPQKHAPPVIVRVKPTPAPVVVAPVEPPPERDRVEVIKGILKSSVEL